MTIIIICVAAIVVLGVVVALFSRGSGDDNIVVASGDCSSCDGNDPKCEQVCMMEAATKEIEYFDDEELDKYSHRDSSAYVENEVEEFREVFYSVMDEEKPRWVRSLQMREIPVPDQLKDEVLMFVNELRSHKMHA